MIKKIIGMGEINFGSKRMHLGETSILIPDNNKIKQYLKWKPGFNIRRGLKALIDIKQ